MEREKEKTAQEKYYEDKVTMVVPEEIKERLEERKVHPKQAYYEVIEEMLNETGE